MSAPDIDSKLLSHFESLAGDAHLTFVLGAGASAPSGLPGWNEFASRVAISSGLVRDHTAAKILLDHQDPMFLLEAAKLRAKGEWETHLNEALYGNPPSEREPSPVHLSAVSHFLSAPEKTTLSTLNFDTLLEETLLSEGSSNIRIGNEGEEPKGLFTVHHLHGALHDNRALNPIVCFRDYAELLDDRHAWQRKFLSRALDRGPMLLAGTTFRDPDIRQWLHLILTEDKPDYRPLVTIARESLGLDKKSFVKIKQALEDQWDSIGIKALLLQDLTDVALIIRELKYLNEPGYRSPQERATIVVRKHNKSFERLQGIYSQELTRSALKISQQTNNKALRATLWLANGGGKLVRWSTESTRYLSPKHLKTVPTGHDSPWIAGEAIGTEVPKIKNIPRDHSIRPKWKSVLAIPINAGDGRSPDFSTGVLTFGMKSSAESTLGNNSDLKVVITELGDEWSARLSEVAF